MPTVLGRFKTDAKLRKLQPPRKGKVYYKDEGSSGLYLSVSSRSLFAWELQLRGAGMRTIGYYHGSGEAMGLSQAREAAEEVRRRVKAGLAPYPDAVMFPDVWERYEARHVAKLAPRSQEIYRYLRRRIGNRWDRHHIRDIAPSDCQKLLDEVESAAAADKRSTSGGRAAVNNAHASLTAFFKRAWQWSLIDLSPLARIPKPHPMAVRDRVLEPREMVAIWDAAGDERYPYKQLVRFSMLVPLRIWSDVSTIRRRDVVDGRWRIRIQKTQVEQILELPELARAQLEDCPPIGDWFFTRTGEISNGSRGALRRRMTERAQIAPWTFHDFRTAFHTHCCELGAPFDLVDQIERPASRRKTAGGRHYDHSLRVEDKAELLEFWSDTVQGWRANKEAIRWGKKNKRQPIVL
ncbi:MAG: integrase arm-type DNA-binding domain-containing protein [Pseudomonadaceae bacterium]|nr:integrase arm-type DNA-binding domain-containing protein [Pseudomonadaceae bacterium]